MMHTAIHDGLPRRARAWAHGWSHRARTPDNCSPKEAQVSNTKVVGDAADLLEPDPEPAEDRNEEQVVEDVCRAQPEGQTVVDVDRADRRVGEHRV